MHHDTTPLLSRHEIGDLQLLAIDLARDAIEQVEPKEPRWIETKITTLEQGTSKRVIVSVTTSPTHEYPRPTFEVQCTIYQLSRLVPQEVTISGSIPAYHPIFRGMTQVTFAVENRFNHNTGHLERFSLIPKRRCENHLAASRNSLTHQ